MSQPVLADLAKFDLVYLATPLSKYPGGPQQAFEDACALAATLIRHGITVYSPVAHTYPIAIHGGIDPGSHNIWLPFDEAMMNVCDALVVAQMDGWSDSYGVAYERDYFADVGKPAYYLDPVALTVSYAVPA